MFFCIVPEKIIKWILLYLCNLICLRKYMGLSKAKNGVKAGGLLLPPAVGYSFSVLAHLYKNNDISFRYYPRMAAIGLINLINKPFRAYERHFINPGFKDVELENEPIFILGHWRSGTTFLHNLLCSNPDMGYVTTFQSVFPDTLFNKAGNFIFENFMRLLIPATRKGDNVKLSPDYPQEEEFALGSNVPISYYYFWMFPQEAQSFYDRYVRFLKVSENDYLMWKEEYLLQIKKAIVNTNGKYFLSKNPPHTARIKVLLEMFPNAKFIHIHRNPVIVFLSTQHFFRTMLPNLQLQHMSSEKLDDLIFSIYKQMMHSYMDERSLIPKENLVEIAFEDLEENPLSTIKSIFDTLNIADFEKSEASIRDYIDSKKGYKKNAHKIEQNTLDKILNEWDFAMKEWGYGVPDSVKIIE